MSTEPTGASFDATGLHPKYQIARADGRDIPGQPHYGCALFVLDFTHDPHARAAGWAYVVSAQETRPNLASDLARLLMIFGPDPR